jgi:hypothetical protein
MDINIQAYEKRVKIKLNQQQAADLATIMVEICEVLSYSARDEERDLSPNEHLQIETCKEIYLQINEQSDKMNLEEIGAMREKQGHEYLIKQLLNKDINGN